MQKKLIKELENEVSCNIRELASIDATNECNEYNDKIKQIRAQLAVVDQCKKQELEKNRFDYEQDKTQRELDLRERQLNLEEAKFNKDLENKKEQLKLDRDKFELDKDSFKLKRSIEEKNLELKERELISKQANDRKQLITTIVVAAVPAAIGLIGNIIAINKYNRLAMRALNMEYIDNAITPRSYNDCMNNIKNFVSKK